MDHEGQDTERTIVDEIVKTFKAMFSHKTIYQTWKISQRVV